MAALIRGHPMAWIILFCHPTIPQYSPSQHSYTSSLAYRFPSSWQLELQHIFPINLPIPPLNICQNHLTLLLPNFHTKQPHIGLHVLFLFTYSFLSCLSMIFPAKNNFTSHLQSALSNSTSCLLMMMILTWDITQLQLPSNWLKRWTNFRCWAFNCPPPPKLLSRDKWNIPGNYQEQLLFSRIDLYAFSFTICFKVFPDWKKKHS